MRLILEDVTGAALKLDCTSFGDNGAHPDAEVVYRIAGFYYGKDERMVDLEDRYQFLHFGDE